MTQPVRVESRERRQLRSYSLEHPGSYALPNCLGLCACEGRRKAAGTRAGIKRGQKRGAGTRACMPGKKNNDTGMPAVLLSANYSILAVSLSSVN